MRAEFPDAHIPATSIMDGEYRYEAIKAGATTWSFKDAKVVAMA